MPIDPLPNRVLCVAEKPSIAKEISRILGQGNVRSVSLPPSSHPTPLLSPPIARLRRVGTDLKRMGWKGLLVNWSKADRWARPSHPRLPVRHFRQRLRQELLLLLLAVRPCQQPSGGLYGHLRPRTRQQLRFRSAVEKVERL